MRGPGTPDNERERLRELQSYGIMDSEPDAAFDGLTELAAHILEVPIALVSLVDGSRQWFKSHHGLPVRETPRKISFCGHVVSDDRELIVPDTLTDARFADNPLVRGDPCIRFYAGVPLRTQNGLVLGTLCAIDRRPRHLTEEQRHMLTVLARLVIEQLERTRQASELQKEKAQLLATQNELRERESRLAAVLESMSEGLVEQDASGAIVRNNTAALAILGLSEDQLRGRTSLDPRWQSLRPDGSPFPGDEHPAMLTLRTGIPSKDVAMRVQKPSGEDTWLSINAVPLRLGEEAPHGVLATFRDTTEQVETSRKLDLMRERATEQERLVTAGTLAAGVGHEINNPLTFVAANIDMALEEVGVIAGGSPSSRLDELAICLKEARDGADRIRKIVRGLRSFARADGVPTPTEIPQAIEVSINMAMHELRHRAQVIKDFAVVPQVMADESRLSQVLVNLLVNAGQSFLKEDPEHNRVTIRTEVEDHEHVKIEVADNGPGIAPGALARIFDPFFTTKPVGVGTGLGLSISQAMIRDLGGELTCSTKPSEGTTFKILLRSTTPREAAPESLHPHSSRVLVVDDEEIVLRTVERALGTKHEVVALTDPREALRRIENGEEFDVVFCDMMMPHLSGPELFQAVQTMRPQLAECFVFVTGGMAQAQVGRFLSEVTNERLEKPFSVQNLRGIARRFARSS